MKRLYLAFAILLALALYSCSEDTSNSAWLNWTMWEADLAGREVEGIGTLESGQMQVRFKNVKKGYEFYSKILTSDDQNGLGGIGFISQIKSTKEVEYDYPTIRIPFNFNHEEESDPNLIIYNVGTFTEDNKNLHFDSFIISRDPNNSTEWMIQDVTFVRKW